MAKSTNSAARRERLAAALRENLKRRKARVRALADEEVPAQADAKASATDLPAAGPNKAAKTR
ncbi:MAG: hypothetical protein WCA78_05125 [Rhizomicrobium sp.]